MPHDNKNRGSIWANRKKEKETDPDFTGTETDESGREFWISAWKRRPDASPNAPALTWSRRAKQEQPAASTKSISQDMDDEIPF